MLAALGAVALMSAGITSGPLTAYGSFPGTNGRLAFASDRDGGMAIYTANPDGTDVVKVPTAGLEAADPDWSPNGRRIAFASRDVAAGGIYVVDVDGSNLTRLTAQADDRRPAWSPDGTRIAYIRAGWASEGILGEQGYVEFVPVASPFEWTLVANDPAFSSVDWASGTELRATSGSLWGIFCVPVSTECIGGADTSAGTDLGGVDGELYHGRWNGSLEIWDAHGRLTDDPAEDSDPALSPDRAFIAFHSDRGGTDAIWVMNADGSSPHLVIESNGRNLTPDWQALPPLDLPPTATITPPATLTKDTSLTFTVTFSETVTGVSKGDFARTGTAAGCDLNPPTGSGSSYQIIVYGCREGTVVLSLAAGSVLDSAGQAGPSSAVTADTVTIYFTPPIVSDMSVSPSTVRPGAAVTVTATADDPMGVASAEVFTGRWWEPIEGTYGGPSEALSTVIMARDMTETYQVCVRATGVTGVTSDGTACAMLSVDGGSPSATLTPPATPTSAASLSYTLAFSEPVTGLAASDLTLAGTAAGCAVGTPSGSGSSYTVEVTGCGEGTVVLTLTAGSVSDGAGNPGPAADVGSAAVTIDRTAPTSAGSIAATVTAGTSVPVGYTASDGTGSGLALVTAYYSTSTDLASPVACGITAGTATSGTITCTIPAVDGTYYVYTRATDLAGNTETAPGTADDTILRDGGSPSATLTPPATPTSAASLSYTLAFSEPVTGLAASDLTLAGTAAGCAVGTPSGSGSSYTVEVTGCGEGTVVLTLTAGSVSDGAGNPGPAADVGSAAVTIDRTAPTSAGSIAATVTAGTSVPVGYTASDGTGSGLALVTAYYSTSTDLASPVACGITAGTATSGTITCTIPAVDGTYYVYTRATDLAGNTETAPGTADDTILRDGGSPSATLTPPATPTSAASLSYTLAFSEPVTGLAASDLTLAGTAAGCAVGTPSGSGSSYTVEVTGCGEGTVVLTLTAGSVSDGAGNPGPAADVGSAAVTIDRTAPSTPASLGATPRTGTALSGTAVPLTLAWKAAADAVSGVAAYELERSTSGGTWTAAGTYAGTSASVTAASSGTVRYRVRAVDKADNRGGWAYTATLSPRLTQQSSTSVRFGGTWTTTKSSSYSGGSVKYAKTKGRTATYTFTGRSIALVTTKSPSRGKVKVYVNGVYQGTVDTYRSSTQYRALAWQKTWSTSAKRTIKLVVSGTSGRPRVDLDAFVVVK